MDREHLLPLIERELVDRLDDLDAGIADENVDRTKTLKSGGDAGFDGGLVADVHGDAHRDAACPIDLVRGRLRGGQLQVGDHDLCVLGGKALGNLLADAACCASDDGNHAAESSHD